MNKLEISDDIYGVSYIGNPKSHTVMYVTKKVEYLVENLQKVSHSIIFAERGIIVPENVQAANQIYFVDNPQASYVEFTQRFAGKRMEVDRNKKYRLTEQGYYIGEEVQIGAGAVIEPGCLIGHNVIIGENACLRAGVKIKNSIIGNDFIANENAVIGAYGFTMAEDVNGNKIRIPTLGKVIIGNCVEVGANNNISAGSVSDTVIEDFVKMDALVHIGHDVHIGANTEITAGVVVSGFVNIGEKVFAGVNACIKNRGIIGNESIIGMGATVIRNVSDNTTVAGNPARLLHNG